jgi:hypothetical protein
LKSNEFHQWEVDQNIAGRMVAIIPEGGWPGKNEAERNAARDKAVLEDAYLGEQKAQRYELKSFEAVLTGGIAALDAERRALEWSIRERLVDQYGPQVTEGAEPVDNAVEQESEEAIFEAEEAKWDGRNLVSTDESDIPF